jgi:hypothetical protein
MRSQTNITLIILCSSLSLVSYEGQSTQPEKKSPIAQLVQQLLVGGFTGILSGATFEYVKQEPLFQIKTPDGKLIMPWIGVLAALSYFVKLCYEETAEGLLPKLCSFILGIKGGSIGAQKALVYDWSRWSR